MKARRRGSLAFPILFAILAGTAAQGIALAAPEDWDWNYNGIIGRRDVGDKEWSPFHGYNEIGVEGSWGKADEPLMFATDFFASQDTARDGPATLISKSYQLQLGLRKIWTFSKRWNPYGGAGFALADTKAQQRAHGEIESGRDDSYGVWVGGGIFYRIGRNFNVGLAARASLMKSYRIFGATRGGNSTHIGIIIGWGAERGGEK
jgi:opacity protein-like surface antigen